MLLHALHQAYTDGYIQYHDERYITSESNKDYTEYPKHVHKLFRKNNVEQVKYFASEVHEDVSYARKHGFTLDDGKE